MLYLPYLFLLWVSCWFILFVVFKNFGTSTYLYCYDHLGYKVKHCKYNTIRKALAGALHWYLSIILLKNQKYCGDLSVSCGRLSWPFLFWYQIWLYKSWLIKMFLNSCLRILHTFPGSEFLQQWTDIKLINKGLSTVHKLNVRQN